MAKTAIDEIKKSVKQISRFVKGGNKKVKAIILAHVLPILLILFLLLVVYGKVMSLTETLGEYMNQVYDDMAVLWLEWANDYEILDRYWSTSWDPSATVHEDNAAGDLSKLSATDLYAMLSCLGDHNVDDVSNGLYSREDFMYILEAVMASYPDETFSGVFYEPTYEWNFTSEELYAVYVRAYEQLKEFGYNEETGTWNSINTVTGTRTNGSAFYLLDSAMIYAEQYIQAEVDDGFTRKEAIRDYFEDAANYDGTSVATWYSPRITETYYGDYYHPDQSLGWNLANYGDDTQSGSSSDPRSVEDLPTILTWWQTYRGSNLVRYSSPLKDYFISNILMGGGSLKSGSGMFGVNLFSHGSDQCPFVLSTDVRYDVYYELSDLSDNGYSLMPGHATEKFSLDQSYLISPSLSTPSGVTHFLDETETFAEIYYDLHSDEEGWEPWGEDDYDYVYKYVITLPTGTSDITTAYQSIFKVNMSYEDYYDEYGLTWQYIYAACALHDSFYSGYDEDGNLILDEDFLQQAIEIFLGDQDVVCYEGNTIADMRAYVTQYRNGTNSYSDRYTDPLSYDEILYMCHTGGATDYAYDYDGYSGYYTNGSLVPAYAVSQFHSLICDISTSVENGIVVSQDINWHVEDLDAAVKELFSDGLGDFYYTILKALPGCEEKQERLDSIIDGEYVDEEFVPITLATQVPDEMTTTFTIESNGYRNLDIRTEDYIFDTVAENGCLYTPYSIFLSDAGLSSSVVANILESSGLTVDESTYFDEDTRDAIIDQLTSDYHMSSDDANGLFSEVVGTGQVAKDNAGNSFRYRALTDSEISAIMGQLGYTWSGNYTSSFNPDGFSMYSVTLTALKSVGKIVFQQSTRDMQYDPSDAELAFFRTYGYYPSSLYPQEFDYAYCGLSDSVYDLDRGDVIVPNGYSANSYSYLSWLYYVCSGGVTATYYYPSNWLSYARYEDGDGDASDQMVAGLFDDSFEYVGTYTANDYSAIKSDWKVGDIVIHSCYGDTTDGGDLNYAFMYLGVSSDADRTICYVGCLGSSENDTATLGGCTYYGALSLWDPSGSTGVGGCSSSSSDVEYYVFRAKDVTY